MTTETTFLKDVAKHQMTIIHEDGLHRHIRFRKPDSSDMFFDLITWPGALCYTGDMGTYVFRRLTDMFEFFRTDRKSPYLAAKGLTLGINLSYWAEKLEAIDRCDGVKKFDEDKFNAVVLGYLKNWLRENRDSTSKEERRDLWDEVVSDVLGADNDSKGYRKQAAAHDFYSIVNDKVKFSFGNLWEYDCESYSTRFVWCCYALAWGINQYDASKTTESAAA